MVIKKRKEKKCTQHINKICLVLFLRVNLTNEWKIASFQAAKNTALQTITSSKQMNHSQWEVATLSAKSADMKNKENYHKVKQKTSEEHHSQIEIQIAFWRKRTYNINHNIHNLDCWYHDTDPWSEHRLRIWTVKTWLP